MKDVVLHTCRLHFQWTGCLQCHIVFIVCIFEKKKKHYPSNIGHVCMLFIFWSYYTTQFTRLQKNYQQQHCKNIATYFCILTGGQLFFNHRTLFFKKSQKTILLNKFNFQFCLKITETIVFVKLSELEQGTLELRI